jgi:hypothetical protein
MSEDSTHTDPMLNTRACKTCHVWLPCCVIDDVEARAKADGVSPSDVMLAAIREYLGGDVDWDQEECCEG